MTFADKETACAKYAGIRKRIFCPPGVTVCPKDDCDCENCPGASRKHPTGAPLIEKLKARLPSKDVQLVIQSAVGEDGRVVWRVQLFDAGYFRVKPQMYALKPLGTAEDPIEYKAFINAYYAAFCEEGQGNE